MKAAYMWQTGKERLESSDYKQSEDAIVTTCHVNVKLLAINTFILHLLSDEMV